ncbi:MAG: PaaI family thioesterase [Polyangiales bacterium]
MSDMRPTPTHPLLPSLPPLPPWARALMDDPGYELLGKPSNQAQNWMHANPTGERIHTNYYVHRPTLALRAVTHFGREAEGRPGVAHGGAIATVIDDVSGTTGWLSGKPVVSLNLNIDYRAFVPTGAWLLVEGRVTDVQGRKVWVTCTVTTPSADGAGESTLHAEAKGLFLQV